MKNELPHLYDYRGDKDWLPAQPVAEVSKDVRSDQDAHHEEALSGGAPGAVAANKVPVHHRARPEHGPEKKGGREREKIIQFMKKAIEL